MVWPLYIAFTLVDDDLITASRDLGAGPRQTLCYVLIPLAMPGIIAGFIFTAVPMLGDNIAAALLGGGNVPTLAESFDDLIRAMNYGGASALAALLVLTFALAFLALSLTLRSVKTRGAQARRLG